MRRGVRSRRLAVAIGARGAAEGVADEQLRAWWLAQLGLGAWRKDFGAAPAKLADLLQFVRNPASSIGRQLLDGETVEVPCSFRDSLPRPEELAIGYLPSADPPRPLVALDDNREVVAQLHSSVHHDVSICLSTLAFGCRC